MPWVEFTENFNWTPARERRVTTAYKAGHRVLITTACATAAGAKFVRIKAPRRGEKPTGERLDPQSPALLQEAGDE